MSDRAAERFAELFGPEFGHGKPFGHPRLRAALDALGAPHEKLPPVIHVAGTNGKGSTIAFMRSIAEAAGLTIHAFTKPHLFAIAERFFVAGKPVDESALIRVAERVAAIDEGVTHFDAQVAAAFSLFSETPADLALIETGMGGRDDSTNVIERPAVSVITPVASDHEEALGPGLSNIAAHKAGILRKGVPAVIARQAEEAQRVIKAHAGDIGAPVFRQGVDWDAYASGGRLVVQTGARAFDLPLPALAGAHQIGTAGVAGVALLNWRQFDDAAVAEGIKAARWPARLQPLTRGTLSAPLRGAGGEVWVDSGHNAHAAAALAYALNEMKTRRGGANVAIVGLRARKNPEAFVAALAPPLERLIACSLAEEHVPPLDLVSIARACGLEAEIAPSLTHAMQIAAQSPAPRVLICGSFLLAAEALQLEAAR